MIVGQAIKLSDTIRANNTTGQRWDAWQETTWPAIEGSKSIHLWGSIESVVSQKVGVTRFIYDDIEHRIEETK